MITKEELLQYLQENLKLEEEAVPIYTQYLLSTSFFAPFSNHEGTQIKQILTRLKEDSEHHQKTHKDIMTKIKESSKNVF